MIKLKGYLYILFVFLSWKITEPISTLWQSPNFRFETGLHFALTMITTAVITKVFTIVFPAKEGTTDRFLFIPLKLCVYISMTLGFLFVIIWFFIH